MTSRGPAPGLRRAGRKAVRGWALRAAEWARTRRPYRSGESSVAGPLSYRRPLSFIVADVGASSALAGENDRALRLRDVSAASVVAGAHRDAAGGRLREPTPRQTGIPSPIPEIPEDAPRTDRGPQPPHVPGDLPEAGKAPGRRPPVECLLQA